MLDLLLSKCTSLAHFQQVVGWLDQLATLLKGSFNGPLEEELLHLITQFISKQATTNTPVITTTTTPEVKNGQD